jgi:hypothetical protein
MDSDDDDSQDIWFGPDFRLNSSQQLEYIGDNYSKDGSVEEAVPVDASQGPNVVPESQQENSGMTEENQQKPKAKRNTTSYAQRKLLAGIDLFLDPLYDDKFSDATAKIVGQVRECPRQANGKRYRIEWKNEGKELPAGLKREWLWLNLPSTPEIQAKLQAAMSAFEENSGKEGNVLVSQKKQPAKKRAPAVQKKVTTTPPVAFVQGTDRNVEAMAASASVRTSSTISTLSQNSALQSPESTTQPISQVKRSTRTSMECESSSDDGEDLVEEDNIYDNDDDSVLQ